MVVNMKDMLNEAVKEHYAVGLFNIFNLEWTKAILEIHQEKNAPVILGVSEGAAKYMGGFNTISGMVNGLLHDLNISVPVVLMLDHGSSYMSCKQALEAGFSSIMFDGSKYSLEQNLKLTAEIVKCAHKRGVTVEGEVGSIGCEKDGDIILGKCASPEECKKLIETGIDVLAAGFGNIHGQYPNNWEGINFATLIDIKKSIGDMPVALHGGSGIPDEQIKKAILMGVAKVNISTELQIGFANSTKLYYEKGKDLMGKGYDPRKVLTPGFNNIKSKVSEKITLFGSTNKAMT